jgi:Rieske Fe-S protein
VTEPQHGDQQHSPGPSVYPIGFAAGVACILVGLIINPMIIVPIGAVIAISFGFLWTRDVTKDIRRERVEAIEPERGGPRESTDAPAAPADQGEAAMAAQESGDRFPRNRFLEGATLGLGAVIGGLVTVPAVGFMIVPAFRGQGYPTVDLGPLENFTEGKWFVTKFFMSPAAGEVTHRTAYIRNNGQLNGEPSFTIISNRCTHVGCPTQPNGPLFTDQAKNLDLAGSPVRLVPVQPAGFGCPCHGSQFDTEGNRVAGPAVRALDRFEFEIVNERLVLTDLFSVARVDGAGADAKIHRVTLTFPGEPVTGLESLLYPVQPPTN